MPLPFAAEVTQQIASCRGPSAIQLCPRSPSSLLDPVGAGKHKDNMITLDASINPVLQSNGCAMDQHIRDVHVERDCQKVFDSTRGYV